MSAEVVIENISNRRSVAKLTAPAPSAAELNILLECLLNAPDHGRIKPWQYWLLEGEGLLKLGEIFAAAVSADNEANSPTAIERARSLPLRAPMILVAATRVQADHPKVPVIEQYASVAAGIQNMQLALRAMGYDCMWRTGSLAFSDHVKQSFGLSTEDHLVGFLYIGTAASPPKAPVKAAVEDHVSYWS